jgi:hypothetical protein
MVPGGFVNSGFRPENDIPDLSVKVILVTRGKFQTIVQYSKCPADKNGEI